VRILINALYLVSENLGGTWTYTSNLIWHVSGLQTSHEFVVLANEKTASRIRVQGVRTKVVTVKIDAESRINRVTWEQLTLPNLVRHLGIDVLHSTGNTLPLRLQGKAVVTVHDLQYKMYPGNFPLARRLYLKWFVPRSIEHADLVIAISRHTKESIVRHFGTSADKIKVIYQAGLSENDKEQVFALREESVTDRPYLLSVGSSFPHKNLARLIKAFAKLAPDIPHNLVIVGEGFDQRGVLYQTLADTGLAGSERIQMQGFIERKTLLSLYRQADAFVFPSLYEGFGIPALEAMESGCPVVAADCAALPEVIANAGLFFDPLSVDSIAEALQMVCRSSSLRADLRARGQVRAQQFSWEKMAVETLQAYEQVAG
jgi:glycosyltransferase involved in cell wall biosynthesis